MRDLNGTPHEPAHFRKAKEFDTVGGGIRIAIASIQKELMKTTIMNLLGKPEGQNHSTLTGTQGDHAPPISRIVGCWIVPEMMFTNGLPDVITHHRRFLCQYLSEVAHSAQLVIMRRMVRISRGLIL